MRDDNDPQRAGSLQAGGMRFYRYVLMGTGALAALLFAAMALLVCADVFLRNTGIMTIAWSVEVTEYMLMIAAFLAAPWLVYTNDHIRVDILVRGLTGNTKRFFAVGGDLVCLIVCALLAWQSVAATLDSATQGGMVFKVLVFPEWWLGLPMLLSFVLLTIEFMRRLVCELVYKKVA